MFKFCSTFFPSQLGVTRVFVSLQVSVISDSQNVCGQTNATLFKIPECRLAEDFGTLLESGQFADVILVTANKEFNAHKSILACKGKLSWCWSECS